MWLLFLLSTLALLLDLIIHISTFFGLDPESLFHPEWPARVAFFSLFYFTVVAAAFVSHRRDRRAQSLGLILPDHTPRWLKQLTRLTIAYAFLWLAAALFFTVPHGTPIRQPDGAYATDSGHGRPPIPITKSKFHHLRRRRAQGLSGFFLMFYLVTTTDLFLAARHRVDGIS